MSKKKSLLTKIGDAMESARDMAQEAGASLVRNAKGAASDIRRNAGKARTRIAM